MPLLVPTLTLDQLLALQKVTRDTACQAATALGIPTTAVEHFLHNVGHFVKENGATLAAYCYVLMLDNSSVGELSLDLRTLIDHIRKDKPILYVDPELRLVRAEVGSVRLSDCSAKTSEQGKLGLRIERNYCHVFLLGKLIEEVDLLNPGSSAPTASPYRRPIREFNLIVLDHKRASVDREQGFRYWADRSQRVLLVGPDKTEKLFHHDLFQWLRLFVSDALRVFGETRGMGQDKTDITIVTQYGDHVVEVKWVGTNGRTIYGEDQINVGLAQLNSYMENDPLLVCGYLVVYDARSLDKHTNASQFDETLRHIRCCPPIILFLESETPSEIGERLATERR